MILVNDLDRPDAAHAPDVASTVFREKVRIRFRKEGPLRFISHHDLMRLWDRLLRRSGIPLRFTQGFHPKPWISSPLALALGVAGLEEIIEIELLEDRPLDQVTQRLEKEAVPGLALVSVTKHALRARTVVTRVEYTCALPAGIATEPIQARAAAVLASAAWPIRRQTPGKPPKTIDLRPLIDSIEVAPAVVRFSVAVQNGTTLRLEELLTAVGLELLPLQGALVTRTRVELADQ